MKNGVVILYKEKGYTSMDAIKVLKGILKAPKVGHTGTLDPQAEGVLPVCIGKATKAAELISGLDKSYRAGLVFGSETDTQDASGTVTKEASYTFEEDTVRHAVASFIGGYDQIPPMYSAIWVSGRRMYKMAREGLSFERTPRPVKIHDIRILSLDEKGMTFEADCSKGTYIRALCEDIGRKTGYLAHMESLVRLRSGPYRVEDSLTLDQIRALAAAGREEECLISLDSLFADIPEVKVPPEDDHILAAGNYLTYEEARPFSEGDLVRMRLSDGSLAALYKAGRRQTDGKLRFNAYKMFV